MLCFIFYDEDRREHYQHLAKLKYGLGSHEAILQEERAGHEQEERAHMDAAAAATPNAARSRLRNAFERARDQNADGSSRERDAYDDAYNGEPREGYKVASRRGVRYVNGMRVHFNTVKQNSLKDVIAEAQAQQTNQ